MCLGIPARITKIEGELAEVVVGGIFRQAYLQLVQDVKVRDYVLLHAGFAIQKIDEKEAKETLRLLEKLI
jgi:hydrogenase expression/formation protein HypC